MSRLLLLALVIATIASLHAAPQSVDETTTESQVSTTNNDDLTRDKREWNEWYGWAQEKADRIVRNDVWRQGTNDLKHGLVQNSENIATAAGAAGGAAGGGPLGGIVGGVVGKTVGKMARPFLDRIPDWE